MLSQILSNLIGKGWADLLDGLFTKNPLKGDTLKKWEELLQLLARVRLDDVIHAVKQVIKNIKYHELIIGEKTYEDFVRAFDAVGVEIGAASISTGTPLAGVTKVVAGKPGHVKFAIGSLQDFFGSDFAYKFLKPEFLSERGFDLCEPSDVYPVALAVANSLPSYKKSGSSSSIVNLGMAPVDRKVYCISQETGKPVKIEVAADVLNQSWESHPTAIWVFRCKPEVSAEEAKT